jgi:antitoxin component of MazEF toxin-antitoxin module
MEVETADGALLLKKAERPQKKYKLADILDSFTPASAHPEVDWGVAQGRELW